MVIFMTSLLQKLALFSSLLDLPDHPRYPHRQFVAAKYINGLLTDKLTKFTVITNHKLAKNFLGYKVDHVD